MLGTLISLVFDVTKDAPTIISLSGLQYSVTLAAVHRTTCSRPFRSIGSRIGFGRPDSSNNRQCMINKYAHSPPASNWRAPETRAVG